MVHAGREEGFIPRACLLYPTTIKTGYFYEQINFANFQKWINEKLIPNYLPANSYIVMDNASYCSVEENNPS